jgi:2-polyprenyl-3-methyl-5-hydroxy-6-metoxy-1,4-benzoquinol methylase
MNHASDLIESHNREQREYFQRTLKQRMVPRRSRYLERQVDAVIRAGGLTPPQRILEVGCGMGRYTFSLADRGFAVEGLDLTPWLLEKLREYNDGRFEIPLHAADVAAPPAALISQFDAVVGFFTLHHVHDLDACYAGMARMLRPGGRVVFLEPNPLNASYYAQILLTPSIRWRAERGILNMRRSTVFGAMARAGFVEPRLARFGLLPPILAEHAWTAPFESAGEMLLSSTPFLAFQVFSARRAG